MIKAFGIVNASNGRYHIPGLEDYRPVGAFSFLGRYRVIDFPVSNLSNSRIERIQVYISQNPRSLAEHLSYGQHYNINPKRGKLQLLFSQDSRVNDIYNTDIASYMENIQIIERMTQPYVVILPGNMIFKQDFQKVLQAHVESGADVTLLYHKVNNAVAHYRNTLTVNLNRQGGVESIGRNDGSVDDRDIFMETYVMKKEIFVDLVRAAAATSSIYTLADILNIKAGELDVRGYRHKENIFAPIYDIRSYYGANMEMLDYEYGRNLIDEEWQIYTQTTDSCPVHYYAGAKVKNSIVANGSAIHGTVENSIIGRGVEIRKGAHVKGCIILGHAVIGEGVYLENQIVDKWAQVINAKEIIAPDPDYPGYIRRDDVL